MTEDDTMPNDTRDLERDVTDGWPDEPGNEELARFAARVRSARPALSEEAMARVERAMLREMSPATGARRRRRTMCFGAALAAAAAALLGVGIYLYVRPNGPPRPQGPPESPHRRQHVARVQDDYPVRFPSTPVKPPDAPLLRLEDYRSLYADRK